MPIFDRNLISLSVSSFALSLLYFSSSFTHSGSCRIKNTRCLMQTLILPCLFSVLVQSTLASNHQLLASHFDERSTISEVQLNLTIPPEWTKWGDGRSADWALPEKSNGWIPVKKVRGANLGSLFVMEPWMARDSWNAMGCGAFDSEWECNAAVGMETMQWRWENHW